MVAYRTLTVRQLLDNPCTKGDLFRPLLEDSRVFDTALPQSWLDSFAAWCSEACPEVSYHLIRSTVVWLYPFGEPCTRCEEVYQAYLQWQTQLDSQSV